MIIWVHFSSCIVYLCIIQNRRMIKTIKSKALRLLWEKDDSSKLPPSQIKKIRIILEIIDNLEEVPD
jgi:hypothetical protein